MARILVIDDDAAVRSTIHRILEREGHEVVEASDGVGGMKAFREHPADLVISDMFMPEKDGMEILRELRRHSPLPKIIVVSGGGFDGTVDLRADAELMGAARTLGKPFEREELVKAVREVLGS